MVSTEQRENLFSFCLRYTRRALLRWSTTPTAISKFLTYALSLRTVSNQGKCGLQTSALQISSYPILVFVRYYTETSFYYYYYDVINVGPVF